MMYMKYMMSDDRCTAIRMSPMQIPYLDANLNVIKGKMPNMRVHECGCS